MKKKIIPVLLAIVLIFVIAAVAFGNKLFERFSYSKERADLNEYFGLQADDEIAIVLQDNLIEEKGRLIDGVCYFDLPTVEKYFTDRFYVNTDEQVLLYTTATEVIRIEIGDGSDIAYISEVGNSLDYKAALYVDDTLYIAADYVKRYANLEYSLYDAPLRMQVYTSWGTVTQATLTKDTAIRYQGGIKSDILTQAQAGDTVTILEEMETWTKVKSQDAYIGYVENKYLSSQTDVLQTAVTDAMDAGYTSIHKDGTVNMAFYQVFGENESVSSLLADTKAVNVISPTWFRLSDNEGNITSLASADFVAQAHEAGVEVWALVTDVDTQSLYDVEIDYEQLLGVSAHREALISNIMTQALAVGVDGINIDFEKVKNASGAHFIQFLRELSIETHKNNIVLSVDNYVPTEYTAFYNREEQGLVADYIVIMGYDEYYAGCGEAGPNASITYVENGIINTKESVPAEKIINAIPFYTRVWQSTADGPSASTLTMAQQAAWLADSGAEATWLDEYCQNYVQYERDGSTYQCWLEDVDSIRVKLQVMNAQQIAGVAEWKLGIEDPAVWDVIEEYVSGAMN